LLLETVEATLHQALAERKARLGEAGFALLAHLLILSVMDKLWMEHIDTVDDLRTGIGLQAYGQRDPLVEFKNQAYTLFERLMGDIDYEVVHQLFKVELVQQPALPIMEEVKTELPVGSVEAAVEADLLETPAQQRVTGGPIPEAAMFPGKVSLPANRMSPMIDKSKLGRNDPCWCGSGKKYKSCHWPN
jgi:preprotein translocase subunit SecA